MSYIQAHMLDGERLVYETRLHRITLLRPLGFAVSGLLISWRLSLYIMHPAVSLILMISLALGLPAYARYLSSEIGITNRRLFVRAGLLNRSTIETLLVCVGKITVDQNLVGRLLGYGDVILTGSGGTREVLEKVQAPLEFRNRIYAQILTLESPPTHRG